MMGGYAMIEGYQIFEGHPSAISFRELFPHLEGELDLPRSLVRWVAYDLELVAVVVFEDVDEPILTHVHLWLGRGALRAPADVAVAAFLAPPFPGARYYVAWIPSSKRGAQRLALLAGFKPTGRTPSLSDDEVIEYVLDAAEERAHPGAWWNVVTLVAKHRKVPQNQGSG